jgi:hypothetical protein
LQVVADQAGSKHTGGSAIAAKQVRRPVAHDAAVAGEPTGCANGETEVSADLGQESSRRAKAGAADPSRRTRWLVHAAEGKRVFRTDRYDDRRVDDAAGPAGGE